MFDGFKVISAADWAQQQRIAAKKRSKYNAKKTTYDGHTFDSISEYQRYIVLKARVQRGVIRDLELQPTYLLQEPFRHVKSGKKVKPISYIADFRYFDAALGEQIVEDVKGMETPAFKLKLKLFYKQYPNVNFRKIKNVNE